MSLLYFSCVSSLVLGGCQCSFYLLCHHFRILQENFLLVGCTLNSENKGNGCENNSEILKGKQVNQIIKLQDDKSRTADTGEQKEPKYNDWSMYTLIIWYFVQTDLILIFKRTISNYGETEINCDSRTTSLRKIPFNPPIAQLLRPWSESNRSPASPPTSAEKVGGGVLSASAPLGKDAHAGSMPRKPSHDPDPQLHDP